MGFYYFSCPIRDIYTGCLGVAPTQITLVAKDFAEKIRLLYQPYQIHVPTRSGQLRS